MRKYRIIEAERILLGHWSKREILQWEWKDYCKTASWKTEDSSNWTETETEIFARPFPFNPPRNE